jgi:multidrug transporter EmrE-like cation transporter
MGCVALVAQTWMALCIQRGPNPGLPKTVSGGVNTVLATMVGVLCFGSRLSASNACGIVLSIVGTYLCVR